MAITVINNVEAKNMNEKTKSNWKEKPIITGSIFVLSTVLMVLSPTHFNAFLAVVGYITFAVSIPLTLASEGMI